MSLKAFHLVFITLSSLMTVGVGGWAWLAWSREGGLSLLGLGIFCAVGLVALLAYGRYFLKKLKSISYL